MGVTANFGFTYPDPSGTPSRMEWVEKPLKDVDAKMKTALDALYKKGRTNVTTNASGNATIAHDLGRVPVYDDAAGDTATISIAVTGRTDTSITIKAITIATGANYVGNLTVKWLVA